MDPLGLLESFAADPWTYLPLLLVFSVSATVFLPIPEEVGLLNPLLPWYVLVLVLALGKAVGAVLVLPAGARMGREISRWISRFPRLAPAYSWIERTVETYGYSATFGLLCIPLMTDTVPVYAFSILHPQHSLDRGRVITFAALNFGAGLVRGTVFLLLPLSFGWK